MERCCSLTAAVDMGGQGVMDQEFWGWCWIWYPCDVISLFTLPPCVASYPGTSIVSRARLPPSVLSCHGHCSLTAAVDVGGQGVMDQESLFFHSPSLCSLIPGYFHCFKSEATSLCAFLSWVLLSHCSSWCGGTGCRGPGVLRYVILVV